MDKIGFNEDNANLLDQLCGPLSVWMANKIIEHRKSIKNDNLSSEEIVDKYNDSNAIKNARQLIQSIMDWIRIGLNGNVREYQNLNYSELYDLSKQWHDSLEIGEGDINYNETHPILLDFRDKDGNGFYWADLETKNSDDECRRMGHCGKSSYGYLYSLRQVIPLNNKFKLNKSVLTAAIGGDNILYQLKGPKNSKPEDKYHQYILPLFFVKEEDEYLIQGFGTEYASEQDFKLSDLPEETIKDLYQNRPELFSSRPMQRLLGQMGIIEVEPLPTGFSLEIRPEDFEDYIDGGWYKTYINRSAGTQRKVSIFVEIMSGDDNELWGLHDNEDFGSYFKYGIDDDTENRLWDIVRRKAEMDGIEIEDDSDLYDTIKEVDDNWDIRSAIGSAINDAEADDYGNYLRGLVKSALEFYGNVYEFDDTGAKIQVDIANLVDINNDDVDEVFENNMYSNGKYNLEGILRELISEEIIEKPNFRYDDRWYPSPDDSIVNELVNYRLDDID